MTSRAKIIVKAYLSGESGHAIARRLGLSPTQVYWELKKRGVACRKSSEGLTNWWHKTMGKDYVVKRAKAVELRTQGLQGKDIAKILDVSESTVCYWKKKAQRVTI